MEWTFALKKLIENLLKNNLVSWVEYQNRVVYTYTKEKIGYRNCTKNHCPISNNKVFTKQKESIKYQPNFLVLLIFPVWSYKWKKNMWLIFPRTKKAIKNKFLTFLMLKTLNIQVMLYCN